jgi:hypothetical protein
VKTSPDDLHPIVISFIRFITSQIEQDGVAFFEVSNEVNSEYT